MDQTKRLDWVDAAKGISILLVVMLYATNGAGVKEKSKACNWRTYVCASF